MGQLKLILRSRDAKVVQVQKRLFLLHVADKLYTDQNYPTILFDSKVAIENPDECSVMVFQHPDMEYMCPDMGPLFYAANTAMYLPHHGNIIVKRFITTSFLDMLDYALEVAPDQGHPLAWLHIDHECTIEIVYEELAGDDVSIEVVDPNLN